MPFDTVTKRPKKTTRKATLIPELSQDEMLAGDGEVMQREIIRITRPRIRRAIISIRNMADSPYVQHAFAEKQRKQMEETQRLGQQARGKRTRAPKDFEAAYEAAKHISTEGWIGIPAPAFRNAAIDVCRMVGVKMTFAKLTLFIIADGIDKADGTPLVKIEGTPRILEKTVINASGVADIRWRPQWDKWGAKVTVEWDEDQFSATDVFNLFVRAGWHVGIGEGRPNSKKSNGLGWGRFEVVQD